MSSKTKGAAKVGRPKQRYSTSPARDLTFDDPLLTRAEVADLLGVTERWVKRAIGLRYFPHVKVGKLVRVRRSDVLAYIEAQRVSSDEDGQ
jgi:excisionase family DNA binding protein